MGNPIAGATVTANGYSTTTGADGTYAMEVAVGTYTVTAAAAGFSGDTKTGVIVEDGVTTSVDFALTPLGARANFGYETKGTYSVVIADAIRGGRYTCPESGIGESITVYLATEGISGVKVRCALYKYSDKSLVAETEEKTSPSGGWNGWVTFNFSSPKPNLSNTDYYIVVWADGWCQIFAHAFGTSTHGVGFKTYDTWPDPWYPGEYGGYNTSIYCTYSVETTA